MKGNNLYGLFLIFVVIMMFVSVYLPQMREQKKRRLMLSNLKKGDTVVTIGGIYGEISEIKDDYVKLKVAEKTELKMARSAIGKVVVQ